MAEGPQFGFGHAVSAALLVSGSLLGAGELALLCHWASFVAEIGSLWASLLLVSAISFLVSVQFAMRNAVVSMAGASSASSEVDLLLQQMGFFSLGFVALLLSVASILFQTSTLLGSAVAAVVLILFIFKKGLEEMSTSQDA